MRTLSPQQLLSRWIELFNKAGASGLVELYHDDAINHQVANEPVEGKESIRNMFEREFAAAEMVCIVENLFEDGEWAILEWTAIPEKGPLGLRGCVFFHVVEGKIKFQRGYWDKLSFLRKHGLPVPNETRLLQTVAEDLGSVSPETEVRTHPMSLSDPACVLAAQRSSNFPSGTPNFVQRTKHRADRAIKSKR